MTKEEISELNLPTGIPFLYELDENLKPVVSLKFLGDRSIFYVPTFTKRDI